jgi:site-specific recombinase XerD
MTKEKKDSCPLPLFDTLEFLSESKSTALSAEFSTDYHHAKNFLFSYRGSEATFNSYRREIERFLQWSWIKENKSVTKLKRQEIEKFIEFCQHPPTAWIGTKNVARFIADQGVRQPNAVWRPFVASISKVEFQKGKQPDPKHYTLSQKGIEAIFSILSTFYTFLIQEDYVEHNPVLQIRQKSKFLRKYQSAPIIRRLSDLQWAYVIETAELLAQQNPDKHERTLFIMNALYGMYLRISELVSSARWQPKMGDFQKDADGNWWFTTVSKGNKQRLITVSDAMLAALKRYRKSMGLPVLPAPGENTPLITKSLGKGPIESVRHVRTLVQYCFDATIERMHQDGMGEDAEQLKYATVHWLRHTGISDDVKIRPREHVRDDAGHSSSAITDKYIDVELRARHASARKKKIKPD